MSPSYTWVSRSLLCSLRTSDLLVSEIVQHVLPLEEHTLLLKACYWEWEIGARILGPGGRNSRQAFSVNVARRYHNSTQVSCLWMEVNVNRKKFSTVLLLILWIAEIMIDLMTYQILSLEVTFAWLLKKIMQLFVSYENFLFGVNIHLHLKSLPWSPFSLLV